MPLTKSRLLPIPQSCLSFNGVNQYAVVGLQPDGSGKPFIVYGWSEITIEELIYPVWPKANTAWSKFSMIGDTYADYTGTYYTTNGMTNYTALIVVWLTRRTPPETGYYSYSIISYVNTWIHSVRTYSSSRVYRYYLNGVNRYTVTVPSNEVTVLEYNPDNAVYPERFKRFVLGAHTNLYEYMAVKYGYIRIYSRALSDEEILWNFYYPDNPVRNGLVLWLHWDSIDTANNVWYDKSGFGNHARLYYGPVKEDVVLPPKRVLSPTRTLSPTR